MRPVRNWTKRMPLASPFWTRPPYAAYSKELNRMGTFRQMLIAWGPLGIFAASSIESAGVPNPGGTDALMLLVTIARPDSAMLCAALAALGSLLGSLVFHYIVSKGGEKLLERRTASG